MTRDPTQRFTERVEPYVQYRPSYPRVVLDVLSRDCRLAPGSIVADIGSGTGKLTELLLEGGYRVLGVEPNEAMREAAERALCTHPRFTSVAGRAEATTLPDRGVDAVTAGQAFHWFEGREARRELARILRPNGSVLLVWNVRQAAATPFMEAYERLVQTHTTDPAVADPRRDDEAAIAAFFGASGFRLMRAKHDQSFDLEGLTGRLLSSSYVPSVGHPAHVQMLIDLEAIFAEHQENGRVRFDYETRIYFGRLSVA